MKLALIGGEPVGGGLANECWYLAYSHLLKSYVSGWVPTFQIL
ncbi:hypothetical protein AAEU28_19335 [Pseudoalteromonas sp. SS15]